MLLQYCFTFYDEITNYYFGFFGKDRFISNLIMNTSLIFSLERSSNQFPIKGSQHQISSSLPLSDKFPDNFPLNQFPDLKVSMMMMNQHFENTHTILCILKTHSGEKSIKSNQSYRSSRQFSSSHCFFFNLSKQDP